LNNEPLDFSRLTPHRGPEESSGFLLWKVSTLWRRAIEEALDPLGLTHPQFVILASIGWFTSEGEQACQAKIGKHAGLDPNTTSQILRGLQSKQLIDRLRSSDERSKHPVLTPAGAAILTRSFPAIEQVNAKFFASMDTTERPLILNTLRKLARLDP